MLECGVTVDGAMPLGNSLFSRVLKLRKNQRHSAKERPFEWIERCVCAFEWRVRPDTSLRNTFLSRMDFIRVPFMDRQTANLSNLDHDTRNGEDGRMRVLPSSLRTSVTLPWCAATAFEYTSRASPVKSSIQYWFLSRTSGNLSARGPVSNRSASSIHFSRCFTFPGWLWAKSYLLMEISRPSFLTTYMSARLALTGTDSQPSTHGTSSNELLVLGIESFMMMVVARSVLRS